MPYLIAIILIAFGSVGFYFTQGKTEFTQGEITESPIKEIEEIISTSSSDIITEPQESETTTTTEETNVTAPPPQKPADTTASQPSKPSTTPTPAKATTYKDGTYASDIAYRVPENSYQMHVSLTVKNDVVTASSISFDGRGARDSRSVNFENNYVSYVVGKKLDTLNLSRVGGASLTTNAFNKAVGEIRLDAHT